MYGKTFLSGIWKYSIEILHKTFYLFVKKIWFDQFILVLANYDIISMG